jgi:hypothetical protein
MAIKINCPRCQTPLRVPSRMADAYVSCAHCKGRIWVSKDMVADKPPSETVAASANARMPATLPEARPLTSPASAPLPKTAVPTPPALVPVRPPAPVPRKQVARFITAEATDSTLRLAADGKLPELHLEEDAAKEKSEQRDRSINPLVMLGVLSISVVLSIVLALMDMESPPASGVGKKAQMRQKLTDNYFGSGALDAKRLEPYQILLREAAQAYSRGDYKTQREHYRKVLDMLRADRGSEDRGLTGSRSKDRELEEAISVLLSGG